MLADRVNYADINLIVTSPPYNQMAGAIKPSGMWAQTSGGRGFVDKWKSEGYLTSRRKPNIKRAELHLRVGGEFGHLQCFSFL